MNDIYFGEEDVKYVKPKRKKKKIKRSNHKHIYDKYCVASVYLKSISFKMDVLIKYCKICGRIDNMNFYANQETIARLKKSGRCFEVEDFKTISDMKYIPILLED